jgi:predicted Zn-dependent peptidase
MISYHKTILDNGLRVLIHQDKSSPIVALNILYDVGARDENEERTGFAHLFEHLMFGGSVNIPDFDTHVEQAGGSNNAFTSNDITNYYITLPKENLETALWLESDRMLSLAFTPKSLEVQRQVVIEEFKQNYLNQPYGDAYLLLRDLAFRKHPYKWATIGKSIEHIEQANMQEVKDFFFRHYAPNNAILCVSGDVDIEESENLVKKWFDSIPKRDVPTRNLPLEPEQEEERTLDVTRDVPIDALYKVFHVCDRRHPDFYIMDILSDILSRGRSSRFHQTLVRQEKIFTEIDAYVGGDLDPGLFYIIGKLSDGRTMEEADKAIWDVLEELKNELVEERELQKLKNKFEASHLYQQAGILDKAMELCYAELLGDADLVNKELEMYQQNSAKDIQRVANNIFRRENCSTLFYHAKKEN